jgi:hypothetical protein
MIPRPFLAATVTLFVLSAAMSIYLWQLRRRELLRPAPPPEVQHVEPPASGALETVTLYVVYDDRGELRAQSASVPLASERQQRAERLLRALLNVYAAANSPHRLAAGAELRSVFLVDTDSAVVDVNAAFVARQISGVLAEELTLTSLVETLAANLPGLARVKILVDGKERDTLAGHLDLTEFYDVPLVAELARQLAPP